VTLLHRPLSAPRMEHVDGARVEGDEDSTVDKRLVEVSTPMMLALATVHEIGHLILGSQAHWPAGIMHPRWERKGVAEMVQMNRFFNKSQSRQLQQRLLRRLASR